MSEGNGIGCTVLSVIFEYILRHPKCVVTQTLPCFITILLVSTYAFNPPSPLVRSLFRCCPSNFVPIKVIGIFGVLLNEDPDVAAGLSSQQVPGDGAL